MKSYSH